ncbi:Myosin-binding protein 7 isoform A [Glycine soja]|nr:Myosin-binding protein 7 isoform A [Glycine soja]
MFCVQVLVIASNSIINQGCSMAEKSIRCSVISRSKSDVTAMRDTLLAQQQLLEKLYAELDEEREASATATSEALDMILRLQGEIAVVKMEARHYKRVAEEKIGHAEASLEAFEELMYQKEMQIASLEFQVKAYRHKLMSLGCELQEDLLLLNRSDQRNGENGGQSSSVRRLQSMPAIQFLSSLRAAAKRGRSPSPVLDVIPKIIEESNTDKEVDQPGSGTLDSYLNQIKELNEQVRVISDCAEGEKSANLRSRRGRSCSILPHASAKMTCDQTHRLISTNLDEVSQGESTYNRGVANDSSRLLNVHDVYEVPQTSEDHEVSEHGEKRVENWSSDAENNRLTKPDSVSEGMVESPLKNDAEKKKGVFKVHGEIKTPCLKDMMMTIIGQKKGGMCVDCNSQAEFQKLNQRFERLERERISARQEIINEGNGEEQLRLLKDIQSQLQMIQSGMRSLKTKEVTPKDDVSLASLQEAMLHFWL